METDVSQDFEDYWNEYKICQETKLLDDYLEEVEDYGSRSCDEGEQEADWLRLAGLSQLTGPYEQGRELPESELDPVLRFLPTHHAEAVRRRVKTLNLTVRQRGRQQRSRARKPDIRDVFRDVENSSTGTRSRSATPDSLDLDHPGTEDVGPPSPPLPWCIPRDTNIFSTGSGPQEWGGNSSSPTTSYIVSTSPRSHEVVLERDHLYGSYSKDQVRREPNGSASASELFRQVGHWTGGSNRGDVACDTEGIQMVGYQRLGTIHLPRPREKMRAGSDPTSPTLIASSVPSSKMAAAALISSNAAKLADRNKKLLKDHHVSISRSHSSLYNPDNDIDAINQQRAAARAVLRRSGSQGHLGFEELPQRPLFPSHENITNIQVKPGVSIYSDPSLVGRTWIEFLGEGDLPKLQPLLLLEATALLDDNGITFRKRKPPRRNRKVVGNVFGVSLATLLERDQLITAEDCQGVPLIFQKVLLHLERHGLQEEGILRVAGLQQKVTSLCSKLEAVFYSRPLEEVDRLLQQATCHDVAAVLKRLLRDLPQPLLSVEYIDMFYQTHALSDETTRAHALNLLVLLLPAEYRSTLRAVFRFLARVVQNQKHNKMSLHNVAMIIAPSLFRPQYVHPTDKGNLRAQVEMAEICCQLTEQMLEFGEKLCIVPESLVRQIRRANEEEHYRRGTKENSKPMKRLLGRRGAAREPITRKINNEVDFQDGIVRVNAPQFQLVDVPVRLSENTTAGDVVLRIMEEASKRCEMLASVGFKVSRRPYHDMKSRALAELAPNGNLSCILATSCPELSLQTHYLYEVGGNIGQRQIEHSAILLAVYKENPNAQWLLRCHHRNANNAPAAS
ncbi:Rho GTPase-activating protein conundrum [Cryptotermes secundus]|uniref:Rho GTPase-activating protein conundrum n=2 Tax=Cryptotermes secundus TaxID=105785 RepID=A0A2J7QDD3_9NEOP|nr:rho GTPase-activating protein conundrum [Cryptotermes secundus]XP_023714514.1 rho GTPase-activating protein conundrum [Cryptotermes secundus]XP_023714515.1 rho GTPase-activating protein conundrum [Cryptotermes secundus]XP_023714517.1 rho GTPase-activating protein conundrum [Cryptotermes secundus]XP_033608881.1 rho GTPase-activating protein conundrum [Cryptotermes secundus]PNF26598.1 Rho GTPase-activating protein conundrum [Cryptotermes secundus]